MKSVSKLRNWKIIDNMGVYVLRGEIADPEDKRFGLGDAVTTSRLEVVNIKEGWAETKNTLYYLVG